MHSGSNKMRKTIALTLLTATLLNAEIEQSGFFVGVDMGNTASKIEYQSGGSMPFRDYTSEKDLNNHSFKVGYQFYYARVYGRYNSFEQNDEANNRYAVDGKVYEFNADYTPVFYMSEAKSWSIRGLFGVAVGYNSSNLTLGELDLLPPAMTVSGTQNYIQYGYQVGAMVESSYGVGLEAAFRSRSGNLQEFTDDANSATFALETNEFYFGLNYLF